MSAPANDNEPRLLTRQEASTYLGISPSLFSSWVSDGYMPAALAWTKRWDKRAIDAVLDKASGLDKGVTNTETPYEKWKRESERRA